MPSKQFAVGEHVDVLKKMHPSSWVEAVVVSVQPDAVTIAFPSLGDHSTVQIPIDSPDIQKRWCKQEKPSVNNRVDIKDIKTGIWCQGIVVCDGKYYSCIQYEIGGIIHSDTILLPSDRIAAVGTFTKSIATIIPQSTPVAIKQSKNYKVLEEKFLTDLLHSQHTLKLMGGDGNCLFRSFAEAIYGDQGLHKYIRKYCVEYLKKERNYFNNYIVGGDCAFDYYTANMEKDGVWGDDVEIQAISELYNISVEIYIYSTKPAKTFHEESGSKRKVCLSFHYNSHYNLLLPSKNDHPPLLDSDMIGSYESKKLEQLSPISHMSFNYSEKDNLNALLASEVSAILDILVKSDVEETKKVSDRDTTEEEILKKVKNDSLNGKYESPAIRMCMDMGYLEDHVMKAYSIFGEDVESIVEFINGTIMKSYI
jgi:OTU-like cysteine protease